MDSINLVKGYGKVHDLELQDQSLNPNTKKYTTKQKSLLRAVSILAIFLMSLTLGSLFGLLVHEYTTEPPESPTSNSADSIIIKAVCNVTRYPDSCFSTITSLSSSSSPKPTDPEAIFKLSIRVSIAELSNLKTIISNSNEAGAMVDCQSQIEDALSRLNDSVVAMEVGPGEKVLTESKIKDLQTWISAAMTDQETCLDGLKEMGSTALDEVKTKMQRSKEYISNCLAILAHIHTLLHNFHMSLH